MKWYKVANKFNLKKFAAENRLDTKTRKKINTEIINLVSPGHKTFYFEAIPLQQISDILGEHNLIILQEDNTPWSGLLLGDEASTMLPLGYKDPIEPSEFLGTDEEEQPIEEINKQYNPIDNVVIYLYWYKMPSGKYEINAYIT